MCIVLLIQDPDLRGGPSVVPIAKPVRRIARARLGHPLFDDLLGDQLEAPINRSTPIETAIDAVRPAIDRMSSDRHDLIGIITRSELEEFTILVGINARTKVGITEVFLGHGTESGEVVLVLEILDPLDEFEVILPSVRLTARDRGAVEGHEQNQEKRNRIQHEGALLLSCATIIS